VGAVELVDHEPLAAGRGRRDSAGGRGRVGARAPAERVRWERVGDGPWFDNQVATLVLDGREAAIALDRAVGPPEGPPRLERLAELGLT